MTASSSALGRLIRERREALEWPQEELQKRLKLKRPISISKWERGEAPVPVHHWLALMRVLEIPSKVWLDAARRDHHRQLSFFLQCSELFKDSMAEIGAFAWEAIAKTLAPETAKRLEALRAQYPDLSPAEFSTAAMKYFIEQAHIGLDRNNRPILTQEAPLSPMVGTVEQRERRPAPTVKHRSA